MRFFIEFLNNFTAVELIRMFAEGAFRTSDEVKMSDYTINYKVIFDNEDIPSEELKIYKHLQRVVNAIRLQQRFYMKDLDESFRYLSTDVVEFNHFMKYGEHEREVSKLNIVERRIIFAFKVKDDNISVFTWIKGALKELLSHVLRDFDEADRIGIVIRQESQLDRKATFPIRLKNHLEASIIIDTLNTIGKLQDFPIAEERMLMQYLWLHWGFDCAVAEDNIRHHMTIDGSDNRRIFVDLRRNILAKMLHGKK